MRLIPITEILDMDDKELIRATSGTVLKVFKRKTFTTREGDEGSIQLLRIKHGKDEIDVKAFDVDEVPMNWRGKSVILEAHQGDKGYTGLYVMDDDYRKQQGKSKTVDRMIKVTSTGQIYLEDEGDETQVMKRPLREAREEEPPARTQPPLQDREAIQQRAILDAKKFMARTANLYCLALDVVAKVVAPHYARLTGEQGLSMPDSLFQQAVASIFISARDATLDASLPVKPIESNGKKSEPEPAPPPPKVEPPPPDESDSEIPF